MTQSTRQVRASLFVTCIIDQFYPDVGESAVRVLQRLGVELDFPQDQTCCGQPAYNAGFWSDAKPLARRVLDQFQHSEYVIVPSGSCASMIRVFYPELFHDEPESLQKALSLAKRTYEFSEFIVDVLGITNLDHLVDSSTVQSKTITYHEACHLRRELGATTQPRTLIRLLPSVNLVEMDQAEVCCGFGGTFSVKYPEISGAMLKDKLDRIGATGASSVVACDSSCLMQIGGGLEKSGSSVQPTHLATLLDEAMGRGPRSNELG